MLGGGTFIPGGGTAENNYSKYKHNKINLNQMTSWYAEIQIL
jgi:hypothetical protein